MDPQSPPDASEDINISTDVSDEVTESLTTTETEVSEDAGAYIMTEADISSQNNLKAAIDKAKKSGYKQVLVPMKNNGGSLLYKSNISYVKDTELVTGTLQAGQISSQIKAAGLTPKAVIPALLDNAAPSYVDDAGYRFADDSYFWLDAAAANGGKRWLDPFLAGTKKYISDLARELKNAGFEEVILSQLRFPSFIDYDKTILDGRNFTDNRYTALTDVYNGADTASGKKCSVEADIKDVLAGYGESFSGTAEILNDKSFAGTVYLTVNLSDFDNKIEIGENRYMGLPSKAADKVQTLVNKAAEYIGTNVSIAVVIEPVGLSEEEVKECYNKMMPQ